MTRWSVLVVVAAACGGSGRGGAAAPSTPARPPLFGPYPDVAALQRAFLIEGEDAAVTARAEAPGPSSSTIAVLELRGEPASAECGVSIRTAAGIFIGPTFLCSATRSDETVSIDDIAIETAGAEATVRFRVSFAADQAAAETTDHVVTCTVGDRPACTSPPAIGGYAFGEPQVASAAPTD